MERDALETKERAQQGRGVKRAKEEELRNLQNTLSSVKVFVVPFKIPCLVSWFWWWDKSDKQDLCLSIWSPFTFLVFKNNSAQPYMNLDSEDLR